MGAASAAAPTGDRLGLRRVVVVMREIGVRQRGSYICATLRANAQGGTMKRFAIAAAVCGLALSGCGGGADAETATTTTTPAPTVTVTEAPSVAPAMSEVERAQRAVQRRHDRYARAADIPERIPFKLALIPARKQAPMLALVSNATIAGAARAECAAFDRGVSARDIMVAAAQSGDVSPRTVGAIFTLGVYSFCPAHIAEARAFLDTFN